MTVVMDTKVNLTLCVAIFFFDVICFESRLIGSDAWNDFGSSSSSLLLLISVCFSIHEYDVRAKRLDLGLFRAKRLDLGLPFVLYLHGH